MSKVALFDLSCDGPGDGVPCGVRVGVSCETVAAARWYAHERGWRRRRKADICPECQDLVSGA